MEREDIDRIIATWLAENGGVISGYGKTERIERVSYLLDSFEVNGYTKDELYTERMILKIVNKCHNPNYKGKKLREWVAIVEKDVRLAFADKWPSKMADKDAPRPSIQQFKNTPRPENYKPSEDPVDAAPETPVESDNHGEFLTPALDRSVVDSMPKPNITHDEEFRKLMGFDE